MKKFENIIEYAKKFLKIIKEKYTNEQEKILSENSNSMWKEISKNIIHKEESPGIKSFAIEEIKNKSNSELINLYFGKSKIGNILNSYNIDLRKNFNTRFVSNSLKEGELEINMPDIIYLKKGNNVEKVVLNIRYKNEEWETQPHEKLVVVDVNKNEKLLSMIKTNLKNLTSVPVKFDKSILFKLVDGINDTFSSLKL